MGEAPYRQRLKEYWREYNKKYPTVAIRLTPELKEILDKARGNMGYGDFIKKLILEHREAAEAAARLRDVERFTIPCSVCGKPVEFSSEHKELWEREIYPRLLKTFYGARHRGCAAKLQQRP